MKASLLFSTIAIVALLCVVPSAPVQAQTEVIVTLHQPPPGQLKVADLWRVDLMNTTTQTLTIYLRGTADEEIDGHIVTATTKTFRLAPGFHSVLGSEIQPIDAKYDAGGKRYDYKGIILRTGQAPTGKYTICVEAHNAEDDALLGSDCKNQDVEVLQPPVLVAPFNESDVPEKLPTFSWLPPSPVSPGTPVRYQLKIVEILGRQSPYDAITANPAFFTRSDIPQTILPFPISSRGFIEGRRYAWQVKATSERVPMGESEIWWFTYQPLKLTDNPDGDSTTPRSNPIKLSDLNPIKPLIFTPLDKKPTSPTIGALDIVRHGASAIDPKVVITALPTIPKKIEDELFRSCFGP